jgi:hypothetical protein
MVEDLCKLIGVSPPIYRRRMDFYRSDAAFDCSRALQLIGWRPRIHLREGLSRTYEACERPQSFARTAALSAGAFAFWTDNFFVLAGPLI